MRLFLSIDGAAWKERASAVIRPPSEVRAFAVFETDTSATAMRQYAKAAPVTSLAPGGEMVIPAGITLVNPSGASGPVLIDPNIPVSFAAPGFRDVVALFSLSTGDGKAPSPGLGFTLKAGTASSLYRVRDGIFPVDPGSRLTQFGTYFTGVDTAAPVVAWAKDEFLPGDSTRAGFTVRDNTARLTVMLDRAAGGTGTVTSSVASGDTAWLSFKRSAPCVAPFAARVRVLDLRNTTLYPADTGVAHPVAWKSSQPTCTPDLFPAELDADEPWELFSLPMNPESPIRFGTLRDRNAYTHLEGRAWSKEKGYQILDEDQDLAA
jgi:hypothetical protein